MDAVPPLAPIRGAVAHDDPRSLATLRAVAEGADVRQRQLRGNLPQAFLHALLLECAVAQDDGRPS